MDKRGIIYVPRWNCNLCNRNCYYGSCCARKFDICLNCAWWCVWLSSLHCEQTHLQCSGNIVSSETVYASVSGRGGGEVMVTFPWISHTCLTIGHLYDPCGMFVPYLGPMPIFCRKVPHVLCSRDVEERPWRWSLSMLYNIFACSPLNSELTFRRLTSTIVNVLHR